VGDGGSNMLQAARETWVMCMSGYSDVRGSFWWGICWSQIAMEAIPWVLL